MFYRQISPDIKVSLSIPDYADELFVLIDNDREFLKQWLPWLDTAKRPADTREFLLLELAKFHTFEALHETIFYKDKIAGVLSYNKIDRENRVGHIGYWLGEAFNGKGIMTLAVRDLISLGFERYSLQKVDIRCAPKNFPSRAIPERLGFRNDRIIANAENLYGSYVDHVVYELDQTLT